MDQLKEDFKKIVEIAQQDKAEVELLLSNQENLILKYSQKKLTKFESTLSLMAGLRVILGSKQGYAYTENLSAEALFRTYKEALNNAKSLTSVPGESALPLARPQSKIPRLDLYTPVEIPLEKKMEIARSLEQACLSADSRVDSVPYSGFSEVVSTTRVINSAGLDQKYQQNYYSGYCYPLVKSTDSSKMSGDSFFLRSFKDIDVEKLAQESVHKAISRLGAKKIPTGNYAVVIDREQFPMIMAMFADYLSAKKVEEGKSLFHDRLNKKVSSELLSVTDDPLDPCSPAARPFDDEGSPSQKTPLIERGILTHFLTNLEYAKKMQIPHTANASRSPSSTMDIAPSNLVISQGEKTLQELLTIHEQVIYLTHFSGGLHSGYKESTGDFSMPAEGFLYEKGLCLHPIDQTVMSGNILDLLLNIEELGCEYGKPNQSMMSPDVLIKSVGFAGI